jgi:hypothetical protein
MSNTRSILHALLVSLSVVACATDADDDGSTTANGTVIEMACAVDADCPAGLECEIEEEHGTTTTFCKSHGGTDGRTPPTGMTCGSDADCPTGLECEIEHGTSFCKPHGGDN